MKPILTLLILTLTLNATEYMGKIEPYEHYTISAQSSGRVTFIAKAREYSMIEKSLVVLRLDTQEEGIALSNLQHSIKLQKEVVGIKEKNYKNKLGIAQLSDYTKNQEKLLYLDAKQLLENLYRDRAMQKLAIQNKTFTISHLYLDGFHVALGEYVTVGTKLYELYDLSRLKLEIFLPKKELDGIWQKRIYLDGKMSDFRIEKIAKVNDTQHISMYRVILVQKNHTSGNYLGKVVKIAFK